MGMDFIRAKKLITSAQADNATQLTLVDQERASFTRTQMHSGFLNYGGLSDFTFSTGTLNAITVNRDLNVNMNGYPIKIPSGTVIQLNAPPTTGTWDDLVFIEGWLPQVPSTDLSMQWRIRTVSNVNFSLSPEGICHYGVNSVGYFSYALPQGGLSTPTSVAQPLTSPYDAWQYFFIGKDNVNLSVSRNDTNAPVGNKVALNDVGLYVAGDGSANSKARFATYDGYVYAIPIARIKRRNSGGFSASNFNGGRNYKTYTITIPILSLIHI